MKKQQRIIAGIFYIVFMSFIIYEVFIKSEISPIRLSIGAMGVAVPWIMCLVNALKKKKKDTLGIIALFFFGGLLIPIYLLTVKENDNS